MVVGWNRSVTRKQVQVIARIDYFTHHMIYSRIQWGVKWEASKAVQNKSLV